MSVNRSFDTCLESRQETHLEESFTVDQIVKAELTLATELLQPLIDYLFIYGRDIDVPADRPTPCECLPNWLHNRVVNYPR